MSFPGSGAVPFWGIVLFLIATSAIAIAVSGLWPPIHYRRLVTAVAFALIALSYILVDQIPSLRLPMQVFIVVECEVLDQSSFREDMRKLGEEPILVGEIGLLVLAAGPDSGCSADPPTISGLQVFKNPPLSRDPPLNRDAAIERAKQFLDADRPRHWAAWPRRLARPRIVLAHTPDSPLAPAPSRGMSPEAYVRLQDGRDAELYHESHGRVPFRNLRVTVTPAAITEEDRVRGIMIELADPRLRGAARLKATFSVRTVVESKKGECVVDEERHKPDPIVFRRGDKPEVKRMTNFFARLDRKPQDGESRLDVFWKQGFPLSGCKGRDAWIAFDLELNVTLDTGGVIGDRRTVMVRILPTAGLALVTPEGSSKAQRAATGWESDDRPSGHDFDGGPGLTELLEILFEESERQEHGHTAISSQFLKRTKLCWFKGVKDAQRRSDNFKDCLDRTHRLAIVGLNASGLKQLDHEFEIENTVRAGRINVMVAAPAYGTGDDLPPWAPVLTTVPPTGLTTLRTEPRVHLLVSTRDTLRMKSRHRSGLAAQKDFINAVVTHGGRIGPSGRMHQCVRGEEFSQEEGGLAWFAYPRVPRQAFDMTTLQRDNVQKHESRLKGVLRSQRFGRKQRSEIGRKPGDYVTNIICNSPVRRLDHALSLMKKRQELMPEAAIPRAVLTVFAENDKHVGLQGLFKNKLNSCPISEKAFKRALRQFATAGGDVLILPVEDAFEIDADERVLEAATGNKLVKLQGLVRQLREITGSDDSVHLLLSVVLNEDEDAEVVKAFSDFLEKHWQQDRLLLGAFIGDGALSDRRDVCVPNLSRSNDSRWNIGDGCAFKKGEEGDRWASALNRLAATPEKTQLLEPTNDDPFVTGRWQLCTGDEIARTHPHGLGWTSALGFSPFARDLLAPDLSYPNGTHDLLRSGQCYLQEQGRGADTLPFNSRYFLRAAQSLPVETRGGLKLLEHFARFALIDRPLDTPRVHSIVVDPATGNLEVTAVANLSSAWVWSPSAELSNGDDVSMLFTAFDRRTGLARFSISSREPVEDLLRMRLYQPSEATASIPDPVLVPVNFMGETAAAHSATRRVPFYKAPVFPFDGSTIAILGILGATLVMFSPLARRWRVAEKLARSVIGESPSNDAFERTARAAPLFSLQAGLAEWGMHPGTPAAIRSSGLPAGLRRWRSGDQGGAIRMGTLYPLVARQLSLPPRLPEVRLRTASEAADVLILIEGNGALLTPRARRAPGKAAFAARFSAFLGHAVRLSHGAAEILRLGLEPLERLEPEDTEKAILDALHSAPTHTPPSEALASQPLSGRLVYYVCDGLSINPRHLIAFADVLVAEGSQLRIAPIVSRDDADNIGLRRDPLDGAFDDDTETPPDLILARRDALLEDIAVAIARRQASLVVLDSALDTQSLLERMNETEFLT